MTSFFYPLRAPLIRGLLALTALCCTTLAHAHKGSDAYLEVNGSGLNGSNTLHFSLSVAIKDLDLVVPIDANGDAQVTWGEVKAAVPAVEQLLKEKVSLTPPDVASGANAHTASCQLNWEMAGLETRGDGNYLRVKADPVCDSSQAIVLHYSLLREQDTGHRLMVVGQMDGSDFLLSISPNSNGPTQLHAAAGLAATVPGQEANASASDVAPAVAVQGRLLTVWRYLMVGTEHLLEGYDHLAFLLALLLPLQLRLPRLSIGHTVAWRPTNRLQYAGAVPRSMPIPMPPLSAAQSAPWHMLLRTVTAFTLGHSITLALATLGYTSASPAWVEPAIAASIGATAWLNLYPKRWARTELLAGAFGLVHGYGFAGLLIDGAAPAGLLGWALAGFNLGVEVGQLVAVSAWVMLSQLAVNAPWYHTWVVRRGSWLLIGLSTYWFVQRVAWG